MFKAYLLFFSKQFVGSLQSREALTIVLEVSRLTADPWGYIHGLKAKHKNESKKSPKALGVERGYSSPFHKVCNQLRMRLCKARCSIPQTCTESSPREQSQTFRLSSRSCCSSRSCPQGMDSRWAGNGALWSKPGEPGLLHTGFKLQIGNICHNCMTSPIMGVTAIP